ncbi:MAG: N-acetyltransferase [Alphaproteobacteria bacterium]|nr:GNAT family N-acetyltransferase [Rhodobiaceae bacterium]MBO6543709.1 N-acetyltransferase [Alphaproteobacteria bacterium]MBO6627218.1 N-acetyltransferase [Alphaproteobacteria bacterium]MDF1626604.1 N-acetyltransferase [Parvibaculaceae bacterium]
MHFDIFPETSEHQAEIDALHDLSFGPGRYAKTAYRLREGIPDIAELCFVTFAGEGADYRMVGSIRYAPVLIAGRPALMLGPLAMDPAVRGKGGGIELMRVSLEKARALGHDLVILVGDPVYYAKVGFKPVPHDQITLPGPVDKSRLLYLALRDGAFDGVEGQVSRITA